MKVAVLEVRRNEIRDMMLQGKATAFIVAYCKQKYCISKRMIEKDITAIYKGLRLEFQTEKEEIVSKHIMRYEYLYQFYMDAGTTEEPNVHFNPFLASKMLEKKEKLLQLHRPDVVVNMIDKQQNINVQAIINNATVDELLSLKEKNGAR